MKESRWIVVMIISFLVMFIVVPLIESPFWRDATMVLSVMGVLTAVVHGGHQGRNSGV